MKLGMIVRPEAASFESAKELGLDFVEFDCNHAPGREAGNPFWDGMALKGMRDEFKAAIDKTGVPLGAVGRWGSRVLDGSGRIIDEEFEQVRALIDLCAELGAPSYLVSVSYVKELTLFQNYKAAIDYLNRVVDYAGKYGITVSIVNCLFEGLSYIREPNSWRIVLPEVPGLKIKYDPSHSFVHGGPTGAYIEEGLEFGDKFGYVHVKGVVQGAAYSEKRVDELRALSRIPELSDMAASGMDLQRMWYDNPPAGMDVINWPAFMAILYKSGYDGQLSIEPHSRTWRGELGDKGVKFTIRYMRGLML